MIRTAAVLAPFVCAAAPASGSTDNAVGGALAFPRRSAAPSASV